MLQANLLRTLSQAGSFSKFIHTLYYFILNDIGTGEFWEAVYAFAFQGNFDHIDDEVLPVVVWAFMKGDPSGKNDFKQLEKILERLGQSEVKYSILQREMTLKALKHLSEI